MVETSQRAIKMEWADQEKIRMAIVAIHGEARYYEGLDVLCKLVGWKSFRCEGLYPEKEMSDWIRSKGGGNLLVGSPATVAPEAKKDERSALDVLQEALNPSANDETSPPPVAKKRRGWPKGKKRGPRKANLIDLQAVRR